MSHGQSRYAQEFSKAFGEFDAIRKQETRSSECGQEFVLVDNVTQRLRARSSSCPSSYDGNLDWLIQTAYLQHDSTPPEMKRQHYEGYLAIFYTLLDVGAPSLIHLFKEAGLKTLPIDRGILQRHIKAPPNFPNFYDEFDRKQFAWCPIRFKLEMGRTYCGCVSPLVRKKKITPYRGGKGPRDNTATLYAIDVPEELVDPELQSCMTSSKVDRKEEVPPGSISKGYMYRFALKQFKQGEKMNDHFENERKTFSNLQQQDGMIRYIGWYQSSEPVDGVAAPQDYNNIVLELAAFDFYEAILKESPPVSFGEIQEFWESMCEISKTLDSIHTVVIDPHPYLTLHGDIKPENILRVGDRFKLADPGEASMFLKSSATSVLPQSKVLRGTRTYAAPEKAAYFNDDSGERSKITQKSDVWSLGCVLSIAATYVVLGKQGFLIYNELRRQTIHYTSGTISDEFHDGNQVLPSVTQWHEYIREAARKTDPFTEAVLDLVDNHMLVSANTRWEAKAVSEEFQRILDRITVRDSRVPYELLDLIGAIDLEVKRYYDQHSSGFTRVDSGDIPRQLKERDLPQSEIEIDFESRRNLLKQPIQPTAQRSRTPRPALSQIATELINAAKSPGYSISNERNRSISPAAHRPNYFPSDISPAASESLTDQPEDGLKIIQVKQMLKEKGLLCKPTRISFSSLLGKRKRMVKGTVLETSKFSDLDKRLVDNYRDRDIVFLVDNGTTMSSWWTNATEVLEVLVWRVLGYDEDGMELYFTNPDTKQKAIVNSTAARSFKVDVRKYVKAMGFAEPSESGSGPCDTTIVPELQRIINDYDKAKGSKTQPRKKTIIILTDGIWSGMHDEHTVDVYLRSAFHLLKDSHHPQDISQTRPITIQFIQFGNEPKATERLRRLDDDLKSDVCPDLVDTEHVEGDVYKMFLGSLCPDLDRKSRYTLGPVPTAPPSPQTGQTQSGTPGYANDLSHRNSYRRPHST